MVHLVITVQVGRDRVDEYLELQDRLYLPALEAAGAQLLHCWTTSRDLGEDVDVQCAWTYPDDASWSRIRTALLDDRRGREFSERAASIRKGGTRRVFYPRPSRDGPADGANA